MIFVDILNYFLEVFHFVLYWVYVCLIIGYEHLGMLLISFIEYAEITATNVKVKIWKIRFFLNQAVCQGILVLLFMFSKVAHIQVLLVTSFNLAYVFFSLLLIFKVYLYVLLEISGSCKWFATFITNERFLLSMYTSMSVEVRLLIKSLLTLIEITLVWFKPSMCHFMALKAWLNGKFFVTIVEFAYKPLF